MRFLIMGLNYLPESTAIGPYTADLAECLSQRGHDVHVITGFPMAPQWRVWPPYEGKHFQHGVINGVPILRTYLYVPKQPGKALNRFLFDVSFAVSSLLGGLTAKQCDLIVVVSPPLQLGLTGWLLSFAKSRGFFLHLQDLIPDAAIAVGMLEEGSIPTRIAHALERFVYRRARGIGVICEGFKRNLVAKGVPPDRIVVLPNSIDLEFMRSLDRRNGFREQHGIDASEFVVMYSGSVALKQGLQTFVEAAAEFRGNEGVVFYLVGEGPYLGELKRRGEELALANLRFLPLQARDNLPIQLAAADAFVITQRKTIRDVVFPGKLLYYMASGRPIVAAVGTESETGRFVTEHEVGLVVASEEPKALADGIRFLMERKSEAERLGGNGRRVAEETFDRRVVLRRFAEHLELLVENS